MNDRLKWNGRLIDRYSPLKRFSGRFKTISIDVKNEPGRGVIGVSIIMFIMYVLLRHSSANFDPFQTCPIIDR
jgi:hypothetical protein